LTCVVVLKTLWHYRASVWCESLLVGTPTQSLLEIYMGPLFFGPAHPHMGPVWPSPFSAFHLGCSPGRKWGNARNWNSPERIRT